MLLKIRRGETPFYSWLRDVGRAGRAFTLPVPRFLYPLLRGVFHIHHALQVVFGWLGSFFFVHPIFRARCESVGRRFRIWRMPYMVGHTRIYIGDDVNFFGKVDIFSGRLFDEPKLVLHNRVDIGPNVIFVVNKEIVIEDDVNVASGVRFMDTDAHPRDTAERIADLPPRPEEVKAVRICRHAWIGQNVFIMKGVTVGEGAIIGVNSVVVNDIPPHSIAMGNPARVVMKNATRPADGSPAPTA